MSINSKKITSIIITLIFITAQPVYATDSALSVSTRTTSASVTSVNSNGVTARVSTSFDVPLKYRNQFPRNSARYVQVPKLRVIEGAKAAKKGSPLALAVLAAVAAAGWAIDELTGQIVIHEDLIPEWDPNYNWTVSQNTAIRAATAASACAIHASNIATVSSFTSTDGSICYGLRNGNPNYAYANVWQRSGSPDAPPDPISLISPVPQPQIDSVLWEHLQTQPHHVLSQALSPNGDPLNTPEIAADLSAYFSEIAANNPNLAYDPATNTFTYTDPDTGEQISTQPDSSSEVNPLDLPDDYARENTQFDILTALQEFFNSEYELQPEEAVNMDILDPNSSSFVYNPVLDQISTLPDLPDVIPLADFGIQSGSCQTITFNWDGASVVFPSSDQCSKLNQLKQIMGWFLYVTTWFAVVYIIIGFRKVKAV